MFISYHVCVRVPRSIRHLPVLDKEGCLLGMLSIRNLLEARMKELYMQLEAASRGGV